MATNSGTGAATDQSCPLCPLCVPQLAGELWRTPDWVVIDAQDPMFPGLTRVIWLNHLAEMTDLSHDQRHALMEVVFSVESVVRQTLRPHKVNLASLGNQVPHLHWHVIPRWQDDATFPASIWTPNQDTQTAPATQAAQLRRQTVQGALTVYHQALIQRLTA